MSAPLPDNAFEPDSRAAWRDWLQEHHTQPGGVRLVIHKLGSPTPNLSSAEAVEEALCFGWIDSVGGKLDLYRSTLYIAPRKTGSGWSAVNKEKIGRMQAAGLMTAAGQAKIDAAIADGSWTKLNAVDALEVPPDLHAALDSRPGASANWDAFPCSVRRGILEWIVQAKTDVTRQKRVLDTAEKAAQNERANQWQGKA